MDKINKLRNKINKIDADIIKRLSQRKALSVQIGELKKTLNGEIEDVKREQELLEGYEKLCLQYQLKPEFIKELFEMIIKNSRDLQR